MEQIEILEIVDENGRLTGKTIPRSEAHRIGALHRGANVILINNYGEILLEKRAPHRNVFPNRYELPGGHVGQGSNYKETMIKEIEEEIGITPDINRLLLIGEPGEFEEELRIVEQGIHNREKKSIFIYLLTSEEEEQIIERNNYLSSRSAKELEMLKARGESSALLFLSLNNILEDFKLNRDRFASAIAVALQNNKIMKEIQFYIGDIINRNRKGFIDQITPKIELNMKGKNVDDAIIDLLLPQPDSPAEEHLINKIFKYGKDTLAGAYAIGPFRSNPRRDVFGEEKLSDPFNRYVKNELDAIVKRIAQQRRIEDVDGFMRKFYEESNLLERAENFVKNALHFPMDNGDIFRNRLSNLQEIGAARQALRIFLTGEEDINEEMIYNPLKETNILSNKVVREILQQESPSSNKLTYKDIRRRVLQSVMTNAIDYNNPDSADMRQSTEKAISFIKSHLSKERCFSLNFGGEYFLREFFKRYLDVNEPVNLVFLPDNNGQAIISLKLAEDFLRINSKLIIYFIPKNGQYSDDLSWQDVEWILREDASSQNGVEIFSFLRKCRQDGRFILIKEGPQLQGIDPSRISTEMAEALESADVIFAEEQAYAEIRGWRKPIYIAFQIKGRIAQTAHGISKEHKACAFVGIRLGIDHFCGFHPFNLRRIKDRIIGKDTQFDVAKQTTKEYVECIRSENYSLIVKHLFQGDESQAIEAINSEAERLNKTFTEVIQGSFPYSPEIPMRLKDVILNLYRNVEKSSLSFKRAEVRAGLALIFGQYIGLSFLQSESLWKKGMLGGLDFDTLATNSELLELELLEDRILRSLITQSGSISTTSYEERLLHGFLLSATILESVFFDSSSSSNQKVIKTFFDSLRSKYKDELINKYTYFAICSLFSDPKGRYLIKILNFWNKYLDSTITNFSEQDMTFIRSGLFRDYDWIHPFYPFPEPDEVKRIREKYKPEVMACGGGGGFNQVALEALRFLRIHTVAGVPSTDDGGSTGKLQNFMMPGKGFTFGVGDGASVIQDSLSYQGKHPLFAFRPPSDNGSFLITLLNKITDEVEHPTYSDYNIRYAPDFLSFVSNQIHMAKIIDEEFCESETYPDFLFKGSSVRNLNVIAVYHITGAFRDRSGTDEDMARVASYVLEQALGAGLGDRMNIQFLPVTYEEATLYATYQDTIPAEEIKRLKIPIEALDNDGRRVIGQKYIDQIVHNSKIVDFGIIKSIKDKRGELPHVSKEYLENLNKVNMFILGAGSLYGSQLAQLAIPEVVDTLVARKDIRKVLLLNHVNLNETNNYSLKDHIMAIERLANKVVKQGRTSGSKLSIGDLFTDVIIPKTIVKEIEEEIERSMSKGQMNEYGDTPHTTYPSGFPCLDQDGNPIYVDSEKGILRNRYVYYVINHPEFRKKNLITPHELKILGYLEQSHILYKSRAEKGRYRGAIYAREEDIEYIVNRGIPRRNIIEVELISEKEKILKAEGATEIEKFPGLTSEVLAGIFKILLQKGVYENLSKPE